jgi:hypothetical protein
MTAYLSFIHKKSTSHDTHDTSCHSFIHSLMVALLRTCTSPSIVRRRPTYLLVCGAHVSLRITYSYSCVLLWLVKSERTGTVIPLSLFLPTCVPYHRSWVPYLPEGKDTTRNRRTKDYCRMDWQEDTGEPATMDRRDDKMTKVRNYNHHKNSCPPILSCYQ